MLATLPEVKQRYSNPADEVFKSAPSDVAGDFSTQVGRRKQKTLRCVVLVWHALVVPGNFGISMKLRFYSENLLSVLPLSQQEVF